MTEIQLQIPGVPKPPRPNSETEEIRLAAAKKVGAKMEINDHDIASLARTYTRYQDILEFAVELVNSGWNLTRDDLDYLEEMDSLIEDGIKESIRKWVIEFDIQPPFKIGDKVSYMNGVLKVGHITEIRNDIAEYYIKELGQDDEKTGSRRVILNYEKVSLVADRELSSEA